MTTCSVPDCDKPKKKRSGMCSMHTARWSRNKTLELVDREPPPLADSIEQRVIRSAGCWTWCGYHDRNGYAVFRRGDQNIRVYRWMYERHVGPPVEGLVIDHACRNASCVNPDHLRQITVKQNVEHFTTPLRSSNTSGYRGVSFHKASGLWVARVKSGDQTRATYHKTKEDAGAAAHRMRLAMHTHNDAERAS